MDRAVTVCLLALNIGVAKGAADQCLTCRDTDCEEDVFAKCDISSASSIPELGISIENTNSSSFGCLEVEYLEDLNTKKLKQCIMLSDETICQVVQRKVKAVRCKIFEPSKYQWLRKTIVNDDQPASISGVTSTASIGTIPEEVTTESASTESASSKATQPPTTTKSTSETTATNSNTDPSDTASTIEPFKTTPSEPTPSITTSSETTPSIITTTVSPASAHGSTEEPDPSSTQLPGPTTAPDPEVTTFSSTSSIVSTEVPILAIVTIVLCYLQ